jgi:uncharacterized protein
MQNLILHTEQIKDKDLLQDFEEPAEAFPVLADMVQNRECEFLEPLKISVKAIRIRDLFEVEGFFKTRVRLSCNRCLKDFDMPLTSNFALTYTRELPDIKGATNAEEVELRLEDIELIYFLGEEIDLRDGIQEQVVMTFPLRTVCAQTCKGLCPKCGADLNQGDCGCKHEPVSNKFAVLKNLKLDKK